MASESTKLLNSASSQDFDVLEKTEWELNTFEDTPSYLRSPFILGSYRVHFSLKLCLLSLVKLHNEVLNIHTHFFGCLAFVGTYIYLYVRYLSAMQSWVHFFIISLYVLAVACYACVARLDYSGIGLVILTSQWGAMTYAFVCWEEAFIVFASVLGVFTVIVVIGPMFKAFHHQKYRVPRALLYVLLSVVFPVTWWLMLSVKHGFACRAVVVEFYQGMGLCYLGYGVGIFFYLSRFPERLWPGKFDLVPSHSFWHLGVIAGAGLLLFSFLETATSIGDKSCEQLLNSTWYQ